MNDGASNAVSVIVPVLQRASILALFLDSLCATLPGGAQLILVDDGCGADARDVLDRVEKRSGEKFDLAVLRHGTPQGDAASCNEALRHATADIVVRLESDAIVEGDWLEHDRA